MQRTPQKGKRKNTDSSGRSKTSLRFTRFAAGLRCLASSWGYLCFVGESDCLGLLERLQVNPSDPNNPTIQPYQKAVLRTYLMVVPCFSNMESHMFSRSAAKSSCSQEAKQSSSKDRLEASHQLVPAKGGMPTVKRLGQPGASGPQIEWHETIPRHFLRE